ncbi:MAG: hypothetical protein OXC10_16355 [Rhodospirillaceae bacterium]|nr:hypothetical protein [Rhodospirillaceae bacterium]
MLPAFDSRRLQDIGIEAEVAAQVCRDIPAEPAAYLGIGFARPLALACRSAERLAHPGGKGPRGGQKRFARFPNLDVPINDTAHRSLPSLAELHGLDVAMIGQAGQYCITIVSIRKNHAPVFYYTVEIFEEMPSKN